MNQAKVIYYQIDDKKYDVNKLSAEAQVVFSLLVATKNEVTKNQQLVNIHKEAYEGFVKKLNPLLTDEALIKEESEE